MPKPLKKASGTLPVPPKPKRSSDPNRAAKSILAEHMARLESDVTPPYGDTFQEQLSAHMAKLGAKGGKVGGKRRLETMTSEERSLLALKAARARWGKKKR